MDITPDLTVRFAKNFVSGLAWEDKKPIGDGMWDNNSECAGQAFDQLMLTKSGLGGVAYGFMSTYNGVRIFRQRTGVGAPHLLSLPHCQWIPRSQLMVSRRTRLPRIDWWLFSLPPRVFPLPRPR